MSDVRFTDGNLIILYAVDQNLSSSQLPPHIIERVNSCKRLHQIILRSKPDGNKTIILLVAGPPYSESLKRELINGGIDEKVIKIESDSEKISHCLNNLKEFIKKRVNPPYIYFVGSFWMKGIFDSIVEVHFQEYKIQFEGSLDNRPLEIIEREKKLESSKKGQKYFKDKIKNKALDMLLNYIFPEDK